MSTVFEPGSAPTEITAEAPLTLAATLRANVRQYGMLLALVLIVAIFQAWSGGIILAPQNVTNLVLQNSHIVIMAPAIALRSRRMASTHAPTPECESGRFMTPHPGCADPARGTRGRRASWRPARPA